MDESAPGIGRLYRELWRFSEGRRVQLVASFALLIGSQLAKLGVPALAGTAINTIQSQGIAGAGKAGTLLALVFGATALSWLLHGPGRILERNVALVVRQKLSTELMQRLFSAPLVWHEAQHGVETGHRVQQSTRALYDFAQSQFIYLQSATSLIGPVIALWVLSAWIGLVATCGYMVLGLIIVKFDRVMMRLVTVENAADRRYWSSLSDALVNILSIFALKMRDGVLRLVESRLHAVFEPVKRSIVYNEAKWATVDLLNSALWISLVALFVWLSIQGGGPSDTIRIGSLFMVYEYAIQAGGVITGIAANFQSLARQQTDFGSAAPLWALPVIPAAEHPSVPASAENAEWQELRFTGLGYAHPQSQVDDPTARASAIRDVALRLHRGRSYALIGPSGSGKTTLLRLLAGLYVPQAGQLAVRAGSAPIEGERMSNWLQSVATLLPQDADLFGGSVRENLLLAIADRERADRSSAEPMAAALSVAQAGEFLAGMPKGLDSAVATRGGNFSGGQRQRIAIARALLAAAPSSILLLDEPTSALDPATEAALIAALLAFRKDACIVASIHRPQLLASFDEVLVVNAGRVVDQGTVDEVAPRSAELEAFLRRDPRPAFSGVAGI
ncbi:MAG TPA: ABC transporter ATP-binding protein [Lautropia sp.]|nr:ABC transporter ATP-binding protein [Lautropia sp.]